MTGRPKPPAPGTRRVRLYVDLTPDEEKYLNTCARIRDIAQHSLVRRIWKTLLQDQMISSILDDEDNLRLRAKGEHRYRGPSALAD